MNTTHKIFTGTLVAFGLVAIGCTGTIAGGGSDDDSPGTGSSNGGGDPDNFDPDAPQIDPDMPVAPTEPAEPSVSASPLVRMNPIELHNTLQDLFGPAGVVDYPFALATSAALANPVSGVDAVRFYDLAEAVADRVYKDKAVMVCTPGTMPAAACNEQIVRTVGKRVFRRPLNAAEVTRYVAAAGAAKTFDDGVRIVLSAMLASAKFLYRVELDNAGVAPNTTRLLNGYETASRLSYALWQSMPDKTLFEAADGGALATAEQVRAQAKRMLESPRARAVVANFHSWWLHLDSAERVFRDVAAYPAFQNGVTQAQWIEETRTFVEKVVFDGPGSLVELFTAPYTYAQPELAAIYGGTRDADGKVALAAGQRSGLLTQGALLATHADSEFTSSIYRGAFMYRNLLCADLPPPPDNIPHLEKDPDATVRHQVELGTGAGMCNTCHSLINPMGFALGNFDSMGRYTDVDANGKPIDNKAILTAPEDLENVEIEGAAGLGEALGGSVALRDCYIDKWFEFLTARRFDAMNGDQYSALSTQFGFETAHRDVRELLVQMVSSMAFRHVRTPAL